MDTNPETIQPPQPSHSSLPLILLHDGGGTTFPYHCLPPLPRALYGIHNPRFEAGGRFAGGICEMARLYEGMIRGLVSSPEFPRRKRGVGQRKEGEVEVLLGGWSLGGYLALELASLLGEMVKGVILIDSPFPSGGGSVAGTLPPLPGNATKSQRLARECIRHAGQNLVGWEVPDAVAPAVLIKARGYVAGGSQGEGRSPIDAKRDERDLGWKGRGGVMSVMEVEGHHFDIFDFGRVEDTGGVIERACKELER